MTEDTTLLNHPGYHRRRNTQLPQPKTTVDIWGFNAESRVIGNCFQPARPLRIRLYKPEEFELVKTSILAEFNGMNHAEIATKHQLSLSTVYQVINKVGKDGFSDPERRNRPE